MLRVWEYAEFGLLCTFGAGCLWIGTTCLIDLVKHLRRR